jgi:hypothetical protein
MSIILYGGTRSRSWLGHYATSRKFTSLNPGLGGFFKLPYPSSRIIALGSTQPLTEMSTRNLLGIKRDQGAEPTTLPPSMSRMSENVGASTSCSPKGLHGLYRDNFTLFTTLYQESFISLTTSYEKTNTICAPIYFTQKNDTCKSICATTRQKITVLVDPVAKEPESTARLV